MNIEVREEEYVKLIFSYFPNFCLSFAAHCHRRAGARAPGPVRHSGQQPAETV